MKLPLYFALLWLALPVSLQAEDIQRLMRKGQEAMNAKLWEVATDHYESLLKTPGLSTQQLADASIRLSESMIRDGKSNQALEILNQSQLQDHPETQFWKGQALAATGRFALAVETLKKRLSATDAKRHHFEAGLTAASLELALDQPQEALKTLSLTALKLTGVEQQQIRLRQINILLDLERTEEARELMPDTKQVDPSLQSSFDFTDAGILLREGEHAAAAERYQQLVENPQNLNLRQHHEAWVGWSDALLALGQREEAADLLLDYIQKYPESTQLEEIFKRLIVALPGQPAPSDPILARLQGWIEPPEIPELGLIPSVKCQAVSAWPTLSTTTDLNAFSMYALALGLHRQKNDEARHQARLLLSRLWLEHPTHFLSSRAMLTRARWDLDANHLEDALHLLLCLRETATSPLVKGHAAFLQAHSIASTGGVPQEAGELYKQSAELLQGVEADAARFNSALIHLIQANSIPEGNGVEIEDPVIAANLKLERALAVADPTRKQLAIEAFLQAHPDHPRAPEARLNAAETALLASPPDISSAKAQIETIEADPAKHVTVAPARIALVSLQVHDLSGDTEKAISSARTLAADFPGSKQSIEASFILGRNLFENGNYNDARIVFEKLTPKLTDSHRIQTAWLLAARSAALIPTSQSQQEALGLFDKAIATDGPLKELAKLERARLMIDMSLLTESVNYLKPWYQELKPEDPLKLGAGLLLGEAIYAQGKLNPDSLPQALAIYNDLLKATQRFTPEHDRLQYLRGLTLEQLPDPEIPDIKREKEALIAYYSVLEREEPPAQWEYFEASGFRALSLLEKARRWPAAIACAKKLASFKGPRAEEAAARAEQIQLKYMIWED